MENKNNDKRVDIGMSEADEKRILNSCITKWIVDKDLSDEVKSNVEDVVKIIVAKILENGTR